MAHNRRDYLLGALQSVIGQDLSRSHFEVILIKNFDDDQIDEYCSLNGIRTERLDAPIGAALTKGLSLARGQIVAFLDDDDVWLPTRLRALASCFGHFPSLVYYHNQMEVIDAAGRPISFRRSVDVSHRAIKESSLYVDHVAPEDGLREMLDASAEFNLSSIAVRRDVLLAYETELQHIVGGPDIFVFFIACLSGKALYSDPARLTHYRLSSTNITGPPTATGRAAEIRRQLATVRVLIAATRRIDNTRSSVVRSYLHLIESEYEAMLAVFDPLGSRRKAAEKTAEVLRIRHADNALRSRVVFLAGLAAVSSPRLASWLYFRWDRFNRAFLDSLR